MLHCEIVHSEVLTTSQSPSGCHCGK